MPLCPQITNTPITVTQTADFTVSSVVPVFGNTQDGLASTIDSIEVLADGKTKVYRQAAPPTVAGINDGDLWIDTDDGNKLYVRVSGAWVSAQDAAIATAQTTADGKNKIFRQTTAPTATAVGDTWFDTDDGNKLYYWTGSAWVSVQDAAIATAQATADSKIKTFYQTSAPTATGIGDVWFDTDDGNKQYRWSGSAWVSVQDTAIAAATSAANAATTAAAAASAAAASAQTAATAAQTTADGKNKVYRQTTQPSTGPFAEGDLWFDTDDDNKIYRYTSGSWGTAVSLGNNALGNLSANKITSGTIDASVITVSNINAGNISTGTLNADRIGAASITGAKIAAGTITAANITAGTITSAEIATGTITASDIATGTITASQIASATITGSLIAAGTITASNIAANTITASQIAAGTITTTQIAAGTITASNIAANTITASQIAAGTITATQIAAGTITTDKLVAGTLTGYTIQSVGAAFTISSTGSISGADTIGCNSLTASGTVAGTTLSATGAMSANSLTISSTTQFNGASNSFPNITQSTSAANLRWGTTTSGRIFESTASSARFKTDIVDILSVDELNPKKLLQLPVHAFRYKDDYLGEEDERSGALVPGFIAEEVDQIYPIAADYELGQPNNWNDKFMIPAMLSLIQDLYKEIALLKGE